MENYGLPRKDMKQRLQEISAEYHLDPILNHSIFSLSSRKRQLLALASAKTPHQCILLFDEPSASLDYDNSMKLSKIIAKMKADSVCVIVADHRFFYWQGIVDRVFLMQSGRLQIYPSEVVFRQTDCPTRGFQLFSLSIPFARKQAQGSAILSIENRSYLSILKKISLKLYQGEVTVMLLFDEPASGLDLRSMEAVAAKLEELKTHSAILGISHDYEFIRRAADRVLCLRENELQADFYLNEQSLPQLNAIFQRMEQDALEAAECSSPPAETTLKNQY